MGSHSGANEVFKFCLTGDQKILAHPCKHLLACRAELSLGHFESEFFAFGSANETEFHFDGNGNINPFSPFVLEINCRSNCFVHGRHYTVYKQFVNPLVFRAVIEYVFSVMHQFQKSRVVLLEELKDLVTQTLTEGRPVAVTRDIRRYNRTLKAIRKEIDKWITEMIATEKLLAAQKREDERKKKETEANADHPNTNQ